MMRKIHENMKQIGLHLLIWLVYGLVINFILFAITERNDIAELSLRVLILHAVIYYLNVNYLLPRYAQKSNYWVYIPSIITVVIVAAFYFNYTGLLYQKCTFLHSALNHKVWLAYLSEKILHLSVIDLKEGNGSLQQGFAINNSMVRINMFLGVASAIGMLFFSTVIWIFGESRSRDRIELSLKNQTLMHEMKFLKSQMNPHFLFNALNNIYSLSVLNSIKTPEMIVKLSSMLRYVLYESEGHKVPVGKEVEYIHNFVEFQRIKIEGVPNFKVDIDRIDKSIEIEPMFFIPFVENSFKHSKIEDVKNSYVEMRLTNKGDIIDFYIANAKRVNVNKNTKEGGIGVSNVKKRLEYLYPQSHYLKIEDTPNDYKVTLKILLNKAKISSYAN